MKRLVALLVVVAALLVFAGIYLPSDAATVGATSVSRQALDSDLSAIAGSPDYTCFLSEERQLSSGKNLPFLGAGSASAKGGVYDATFVDDWLGSMITDKVTARMVARDGLEVTASDLSVARGVLVRRIDELLGTYARDAQLPAPSCGGSARAVLASLPAWFAGEQIRAEADQAVLDAHAVGAGLTTGAVSSYFARHRRTFDRDCLDAVVVKSKSAADKVEAALSRGASFALEAEAASITSQSAAAGGSVGCGFVDGTFLATAVAKLVVGGVAPPVSGDGLYWVVKLASRTAVPLRTVRSTVVTAILHAGQARADAELTAALRSTGMGVDPRYGTPSPHRLTLVLAAPSPPASAQVSLSANLPKLTAASGGSTGP
jgi:hypothetical protein